MLPYTILLSMISYWAPWTDYSWRDNVSSFRPTKTGWQSGRLMPQPLPDTPDLDQQLPEAPTGLGMKRIMGEVVDQALEHRDKREVCTDLFQIICGHWGWGLSLYSSNNVLFLLKASIQNIQSHQLASFWFCLFIYAQTWVILRIFGLKCFL